MKREISAVVSGFESACIDLCELFLSKATIFRHMFPYMQPVVAEEHNPQLLFFVFSRVVFKYRNATLMMDKDR